jgi:hypothetical protein
MHATVSGPRVWQRWKQSERMALLATFEDSTGGTRVKEFCQALSRDLGSHCRIVEHVWLFSTFRLRELQEIAAEEASASDLVIVSTHRDGDLPREVKSWIDLWLQQAVRRPAMLLALLDPDYEGASTLVTNYLQEVAKRGSMEFLVVSEDAP